MKKTLLLTLLAGLVSASSVKATELFITGSTAFRANVHDACLKLFQPGGTPTFKEIDDTNSVVGDGNSTGNGAQCWVMVGQPTNALTTIGDTLVIHASFTGSLQGSYAVANTDTSIKWLSISNTVITHSPTIAFTDVATTSSLWNTIPNNYAEDTVAIQPFCIMKSQSSGAGQTIMNNITNVTWEQMKGLLNKGSLPLSFWTGLDGDTNKTIYCVNRTLDSGTRRAIGAEVDYPWANGTTIYVYNNGTNAGNFTWIGHSSALPGDSNNVATSGGVTNANNFGLPWGPGYVGGGDVRSQLALTDIPNTAIGYLSFADAQKSWGASSAPYWRGLCSFEGTYPTVYPPTASQTNDFTPVIQGQYPYWAEEIVFYPTTDAQLNVGNDALITHAQLGSKAAGAASGSILGLLNHQSGGTNIISGSLEYEITNAAVNTAIPLYKMRVFHNAVSSLITPGSYH